jgi:hypothetical protein
MRHWIWIVLALLTSAHTATATEVIVILTKDGALLSADSLEVVSGKPPVQACKIHQTGCLLWIAAGSVGDTGTGFDVSDFFVQRAANECDVRKNLNHLDSRLTTALQKEVPRIRQLQPEYYQKLIRGGYILSLFAAGVRRGKVETYEKDFSSSMDLSIRLRPRHVPHRACLSPALPKFSDMSTAIQFPGMRLPSLTSSCRSLSLLTLTMSAHLLVSFFSATTVCAGLGRTTAPT